MKALIISPHPDDETLGACGTIKKLIAQGWETVWLNVTNMNEEYGYPESVVQERQRVIKQVRDATGYSAFYDLNLRPAALEQYRRQDIVLQIKEILDKIRPELLFLPYPYDAHSDHKVTYDCALSCTKAFRASYIRKIVCMEIISETNYSIVPFRVDSFVDITDYIEDKLRIAGYYQSEILDMPFPRSKEAIRAQALFRGSACYCPYAEAFQVIKEIFV